MNKKGFTLVEMLVVIAIIAVLVAIIVPTAVGATKKASAAADAANLRSVLAEINVWYLTNDSDVFKTTTPTSASPWKLENVDPNTVISIDSVSTGIKAPACKTNSGWKFTLSFDGSNFEVKFGSNGIDYFSGIAGGTSSN